MNRNQKDIYVFISGENKKFYRAIQDNDGSYNITSNSSPYPIRYTPTNFIASDFEFATNSNYFSCVRSVTDPVSFIKDGAAILRQLYLLGKSHQQKAYITAVSWNGDTGIYELAYHGRVDFTTKKEDPKSGKFTVNCIDDSSWGVLSQKDNVQYAINCNSKNPKAIRVLIDATTLENIYTYQTVPSRIKVDVLNNCNTIPFVLINESGDSFGLITKNQNLDYFPTLTQLRSSTSWFLSTYYPVTGVRVSGNIKFSFEYNGQVSIRLFTSTGQSFMIFNYSNLSGGTIYDIPFDFTLNLSALESVFMITELVARDVSEVNFAIIPIVTNISVLIKTKTDSRIVYALRPLDLGQEIAAKATNNRFSIGSNYYSVNNKTVVTSGDAIRGIANSKIYSSFKEYVDSLNALHLVALRNVNGNLFIEKRTEVYRQDSQIIDLGEAIDIQTECAQEYIVNEVIVGSSKQDYRHPSGRLEFNSENTFSLPIELINKKMEIIPKYRLGCFDIIFLILDYQGGSTKDNSGDKSVYMLDITDEQGYATDEIENFENVTVNSTPLQPIIKTPLDNDSMSSDIPVIKGIAPPGSNVNIYIDGVLDGSTTTNGAGNWVYNVTTPLDSYNPPTTTGIHLIQATYTDLSAPNSSVSIMVDTTIPTPVIISYPRPNDNLYNNKPLIKGTAPAGTNINISLDSVFVATVVTDNSCNWEYKMPAIANGNRTLSVNSGIYTSNFTVDNNVAFPLITYIGSELDGFLIVNNLPLIEGVSQPNASIEIWLDYISYKALGYVSADANGNWSYQVVPSTYIDSLTGLPVTLSPIPNGAHVISTALTVHTVGIVVTGYKLNRPAYSSITGVVDNTVFNTMFSPKNMIKNHYPMLSMILNSQPLEKIVFQTADKNGNLRTILNGVVTQENTDIPISSLGTPLALCEKATITTKTYKSFAKALYDFSNGGVIKTTFRGKEIFALPIGSMKMSGLRSDVQEWNVLLSPLTSYITLLNLYKNGLSLNLNKFSMYHSDYNSLHFVTYNFQKLEKYNFKTIYDDWFENRNDAWIYNPSYIQKYNKKDVIIDQIVTNGVTSITLKMYRCKTGALVETFAYNAVNPAPVPIPSVVLETEIDFDLFPEDEYFFVLFAGETPVAISERVQTKVNWEKTILIESSNSINLPGAFFSTGFKTVLRIEGILDKIQPEIDTIISKDSIGDTATLYGSVSKKRVARFGTAYGLPDYLYIKCANAAVLDELMIEGELYSLPEGEKINPSEEVDGHPLYYYDVNLEFQRNAKGKEFPGEDGQTNEGVVLVVDAEAMGLPAGQLLNIALTN